MDEIFTGMDEFGYDFEADGFDEFDLLTDEDADRHLNGMDEDAEFFEILAADYATEGLILGVF